MALKNINKLRKTALYVAVFFVLFEIAKENRCVSFCAFVKSAMATAESLIVTFSAYLLFTILFFIDIIN